MKIITYCNKIIEHGFYALFLFVPLIFTNVNSELFELNKMWLTWGLTILIIAAWIVKMILQREVRIKRTPLDIFIVLFLLSHIIATIFTLDTRVSIWGYYSRFNGGLLSFVAYIALFYAFVSNMDKREVIVSIVVTLISGVIVALWGLPSHFGYDPTCLLFRGTFDVSCWTNAFKPTIRIFSTLGQPAWMAAFLAALIPISTAFFLNTISQKHERAQFSPDKIGIQFSKKSLLFAFSSLLLALLFYLDLLYANTRGGFLAFWAANVVFWGVIFIKKFVPKPLFIRSFIIINLMFLITNFFVGTPVAQLNFATLSGIQGKLTTNNQPEPVQQTAPTKAPEQAEPNITDSGKIRLLVWEGAVDAWLASPIFGTGVETFAYAYYKHRPPEHNLTSEWDFLYNKAHNEYLNYLATTGILGFGTYLVMIAVFLLLIARWVLQKSEEVDKTFSFDNVLVVGLTAGFISILISNFFGFSVVIMNIYLFFFPLFALVLLNKNTRVTSWTLPKRTVAEYISPYQWTGIVVVCAAALYLLFLLLRFWQADTAYALGYNLNRAGDYQGAYTKLADAVKIRPAEPVFKDEFAVNLATLGTALIQNNQATTGAQLAQQAVTLNDQIVTRYPNNITFWKNRVRIFYFLSQIDPQYLLEALRAIQKASELGPTDAKISYNLGVLYGQNGQVDKAIETLSQTITLKPDYRDAYYARALFYREIASTQPEKQAEYNQKAIEDLEFILKNINPDDETVKKTLDSWSAPTN